MGAGQHLQPAGNAGGEEGQVGRGGGMGGRNARQKTPAGFAGAVEREPLLLEVGSSRAEAWDWAGAYGDKHNYIGGHLPWPLQEAEQPGPANGHSDRASQGDQPHQPTL